MIIPTSNRVKVLLWSGFTLFHYGIISMSITVSGFFNSIHEPILEILLFVIPLLSIITCPTLAYSGWKYIIVKIRGEGEWVWSKEDLERQNLREDMR